jgi:hypothetical protein
MNHVNFEFVACKHALHLILLAGKSMLFSLDKKDFISLDKNISFYFQARIPTGGRQ